jgi:hypothetical protein
MAALKPGTAVQIKIVRDGASSEVTITPTEATRVQFNVKDTANGDAAKLAFRKSLFYGR